MDGKGGDLKTLVKLESLGNLGWIANKYHNIPETP
jgi:hypothetical protein